MPDHDLLVRVAAFIQAYPGARVIDVMAEFDLSDTDAEAALAEAGHAFSRKPGRPRAYPAGVRDWVRVQLPLDLIARLDAASTNRTAFIEAALRAALDGSDSE